MKEHLNRPPEMEQSVKSFDHLILLIYIGALEFPQIDPVARCTLSISGILHINPENNWAGAPAFMYLG